MNTKELYEYVLSPSFRKASQNVLESLNENYVRSTSRRLMSHLLNVMLALDEKETLSGRKVERIRKDLLNGFPTNVTRDQLKKDFEDIIEFLQNDEEVTKLEQKYNINWQDKDSAMRILAWVDHRFKIGRSVEAMWSLFLVKNLQ